MAQWYAQVGGQRYGPVSDDDIKSWYAQGRIKSTDYIWSEGMASWAPAGAVLGGHPAGSAQAASSAFAPSAFPAQSTGYSHLKPHRGTAVLVLGILSLVMSCFIMGIIAWVMGSNDLREMAAGRMDRSGEGNTKAGRICGIIGTCLGILWFIFVILWLIGVATWASTSHSPRYYGP